MGGIGHCWLGARCEWQLIAMGLVCRACMALVVARSSLVASGSSRPSRLVLCLCLMLGSLTIGSLELHLNCLQWCLASRSAHPPERGGWFQHDKRVEGGCPVVCEALKHINLYQIPRRDELLPKYQRDEIEPHTPLARSPTIETLDRMFLPRTGFG